MTVEAQKQEFTLKTLLQIRDYRFLWLGQIVSDLGDSMTSLALMLLVNHLTGSTAALATMAIILAIPSLTFGLFAGVIVDRADRKKVMILSDIVRALFVLGFIFVDSAEKVWILYTIGFVQASIGTFFTPARGALIPNIVPEEGLLSANSISQTSRIIFNLLGMGAAGFIIGQFESYWLIFTIDAATFFISMLLISQIAYTRKAGAEKEEINAKRVFGELGEGLKLTFSNRILTGTIISFAVTML